jgi:hypothetical protein
MAKSKDNQLKVTYVSEVDQFLKQLNETLPASASTQREIDKHARLHALRDDPNARDKDQGIWEGF